jgi:nucleotide-binding universal stress UspA family protein
MEDVMRILLAIDSSEFSEAAIRVVASQMRPTESEVLVFKAVNPLAIPLPPELAGHAAEMEIRLREAVIEAQVSTAHAAEELRSAGFKAETRVAEREDARTAILEVAEQWHAQLIVLGSHGRTGLQKFLLGSVSETVARHAHCSVLIVRRPPQA